MAETNDRKILLDWMRRNFLPESASGWESTLHFHLSGEQPATIDFARKKLTASSGLNGEPLAVVNTRSNTLLEILKGETPLDIAIMKGSLDADNMVEVFKFISVFKPTAARRVKTAIGKTQRKKS